MGTIEKQLQALVDLAEGDEGPGAILGIAAPHLGVDWKGASGAFKRGGRKRLKATDGFRIASMSKTFTATLVMQLVERGKLSLDARLGEFFSEGLRSQSSSACIRNHAGASTQPHRRAVGLRAERRMGARVAQRTWSVSSPGCDSGLGDQPRRASGRSRCRTRLFRYRLRDSRARPATGYRRCVQDSVQAPHIQTVGDGTDLAGGARGTANVAVTLVFGPLGRAATQRKRRLGRGRARIDGGGPCSIHARPVSGCRAGFAIESRSNAGNGTDSEPSIRSRRRHPP